MRPIESQRKRKLSFLRHVRGCPRKIRAQKKKKKEKEKKKKIFIHSFIRQNAYFGKPLFSAYRSVYLAAARDKKDGNDCNSSVFVIHPY